MIKSHLIQHPVDGIQFLFYDTVFKSKHVFTACGVGRVKDEDAELTQVAQQTLFGLGDYVEETHGSPGTIRLQEIATLQAVPVRVRKGLESANDKEILFFVCRSPEIYDAAVKALNVEWVSHNTLQ